MRAFITVASVAFVLALAGCGGPPQPQSEPHDDLRMFTSTDSWFNPPVTNETRSSWRDFREIESGCFVPVLDAHQQEMQATLADVPARPLSPEEAERIVGKKLPSNGIPVLLRAVVLNEATGAFVVSVRETEVRVCHVCGGHHPVPMRRKVIVAVLPAIPLKVSVDCSMAG